MAKSKTRRNRTPRSVLKLPDLEQSKSAVLNSLTSPSSQRTYDHAIREFIEWYCSEPRLAFNKAGRVWGAGFSPKVIWGVVKEKRSDRARTGSAGIVVDSTPLADISSLITLSRGP